MSIPANMAAALQSGNINVRRWLEIEGLPYAYGNFDADASWFAARDAAAQLLGVKSFFKDVPQGVSADIDTTQGIASTMGEMTFDVVDIDGTLTPLTAVGATGKMVYLANDLGAADASVVVAEDISSFPAAGDIYIGTETIHYTAKDNATKTFSGLTRGYYGSKAQAFGAGFPVSSQPYTVAKRRAWYYVLAYTVTPADADKALVMAGTIEDFKLADDDLTTYVFTMQSFEKQLNKDAFQYLRILRDTANIGINDAEGTGSGLVTSGFVSPAGNTQLPQVMTSKDIDSYAAGEQFFVRVDNEVIAFKRNTTTNDFSIVARGCFGTLPAAHDPGYQANEVVGIGDSSGDRFTSAPTSDSPLPANHPIILLLQLMLSTGDGTNHDPAGRNYDVLPFGWGLGIDYTRLDIKAIEKTALETSDIRFGGIVDKQQNFSDFAKNVLAPLGYFGCSTVGDVWTIRYLRPPLPDEPTRSITEDNIISGTPPVWSANVQSVIQQVAYSFAYDIVQSAYERVHVEIFEDARVYAKGEGKVLSYEMPLFYPGITGKPIPGQPPFKGIDVDSFMLRRSDFYRQRYTRPPPLIAVVTDYSCIDVEPGDLVKLSHKLLPDPTTGQRGLNGAVCEVVSKTIDDRAKVVNLTLLMTGYQVTKYRYISPALEIETNHLDNTFTVKENSFTDPGMRAADGTQNQKDYYVIGGDGLYHDVVQEYNDAGMTWFICDPTFTQHDTVNFSSGMYWQTGRSTRIVEMDDIDPTIAQPGWLIIPDAYSGGLVVDNEITSIYAYAYVRSNTSTYPPDHRFFP